MGVRRVGVRRVGSPTQKKWSPEGWGPEGWGPEGWGPKMWGPEGWGAQNFALFFPCPTAKFVLFFPLWRSSRGILVVFEAPGLSNCARLEFSGCRVRAPAARSGIGRSRGRAVQGKGGPGIGRSRERAVQGKGGPGGTEHDQTKTWNPPHGNRETNTHATQAHTNTHEHTQTHTNTHKHTQTHTNTQTQVELGWPKSAMTHPSGLHPSGPHPSGPTFSRFGPAPFGAPKGACSSMFFRCSVFFFEKQENTEIVKLAKVGLAKVGQLRLAKVGQICLPKSVWPKSDWPKSVKQGWPKSVWPKSVSACQMRRLCNRENHACFECTSIR